MRVIAFLSLVLIACNGAVSWFGVGLALVAYAVSLVVCSSVVLPLLGRISPLRVVASRLACLLFILVAYSTAKPYLWYVLGSSTDGLLVAVDAWLHGPELPARLAAALGEWLTLIDFVYAAWLPLTATAMVWWCWSSAAHCATARLASCLSWSIGGVLLAAMSWSVGPCYLGDLTVPGYELRPVSFMLQSGLLDAWSHGRAGGGISAFPSLHVTMTTVCVCWLWAFGWWPRLFGLVYLAFIALGSVALAWHYAVDAWAGIVLGLFFWFLAERVSRDRTTAEG